MGETITKENLIEHFNELNGRLPSWHNKKMKEFSKEETSEYLLYRMKVKKKRRQLKQKSNDGTESKRLNELNSKSPQEVITIEPTEYEETDDDDDDEDFIDSVEDEDIPIEEINKILSEKTKEIPAQQIVNEVSEDYYESDNEWSDDEKYALVNHTANNVIKENLTPEQKEVLERQQKQDLFIEDYIKHHHIKTQNDLNYAIEHDEKFRLFLEKSERLSSLYNGKGLAEIKRDRDKIENELKEEAIKDKKKKVLKKFKSKPSSNKFEDSKKDLDLTPYRNKKLEKMGYILCIYLRKNGLAEMRYVKMDEVGQIKVDGYVYHERDATYRFGKKNDPVLAIFEGSLVPLSKETLKENLGFESAEAQRLIIKGIEQAEVVKAGGIDENAKKPLNVPKWAIGIGIAVIIGVYAYMGGFS